MQHDWCCNCYTWPADPGAYSPCHIYAPDCNNFRLSSVNFVHPDIINDIRIFNQCLCYSDMHSNHTATIYNYIHCRNYKYVVYFLRFCFLQNTTVIPAQNRTWITQKPILKGKSFYSSEDWWKTKVNYLYCRNKKKIYHLKYVHFKIHRFVFICDSVIFCPTRNIYGQCEINRYRVVWKHYWKNRCLDGVVSTVTRLQDGKLRNHGLISLHSKAPEWLRGPATFLFNKYQGLFPLRLSIWDVKLIIILYLVSRWRL
jgi:hypothetical protein